MKTNAIIRIVIWSFILLVLVSVLCGVLYGRMLDTHRSERMEFTYGEASPHGTGGSQAAVDAAQVRQLTIEWVAGDITVQAKEGISQIRFSEDALECGYPMVYEHRDEKLTIRFCEESFGFKNFEEDARKNLMIEVPADWVCRELKLAVAAADVTVHGLLAREVDFDGASGECDFLDCTIGDLDVDAAAGDVTFTGSLETLDLDATSGSFAGVFTNTPGRIEMDGMSGDLDITLPDSGGYTATIDGLSSSIRTEGHSAAVKDNAYTYGDGSCRINLDGISCDLTIRLEE